MELPWHCRSSPIRDLAPRGRTRRARSTRPDDVGRGGRPAPQPSSVRRTLRRAGASAPSIPSPPAPAIPASRPVRRSPRTRSNGIRCDRMPLTPVRAIVGQHFRRRSPPWRDRPSHRSGLAVRPLFHRTSAAGAHPASWTLRTATVEPRPRRAPVPGPQRARTRWDRGKADRSDGGAGVPSGLPPSGPASTCRRPPNTPDAVSASRGDPRPVRRRARRRGRSGRPPRCPDTADERDQASRRSTSLRARAAGPSAPSAITEP